MKHYIGTKAECEAVQAATDKALGYPKQGRHSGGGRHTPISDEPGGEGWTMTHGRLRKHPTKDEHAYPIDDEVEKAKTASLTTAEKQVVDDAKSAAKELPDDWEPKDAKKVEARLER